MKVPEIRLKSILCVSLVVAMATLSSWRSLAASEVGEPGVKPTDYPVGDLLKAPTATLTGTGEFTLNGNVAQSGATVLSGSVIATLRSGIASVDMGPLGRVHLKPNTRITITLAPGAARIKTESALATFVVMRGEVKVVVEAGAFTLGAGEERTFSGAIEATPSSNTVFTVVGGAQSQNAQSPDPQNQTQTGDTQQEKRKKKRYIGAAWWAYAALVGAAGGIAAAVALDGGEKAAPAKASPAVP